MAMFCCASADYDCVEHLASVLYSEYSTVLRLRKIGMLWIRVRRKSCKNRALLLRKNLPRTVLVPVHPPYRYVITLIDSARHSRDDVEPIIIQHEFDWVMVGLRRWVVVLPGGVFGLSRSPASFRRCEVHILEFTAFSPFSGLFVFS
jgi:hypothetical protein